MKYLACAALVCVGCSGSESGQSLLSPGSTVVAAERGTPAAVPVPSAGVVSLPGLVVTGPTGCQTLSTDLFWDVAVNNAGAGGVNGFLVGAFHDGAHGCAPTQQGNRGEWWLKHTAGPESYLPTEHGVTRFAAQARWTCGRDQFDISIRGQGLILSLVVDHLVDCTPETPKPPDEPPSVPPLEPPVTPPTAPPVNRTPPLSPQCVPTNDLFVGGWFGVRADVFDLFPGSDRVRVRFEGTIKPEFSNVSLTPVSWKKRTNDPFPQDLDTIGPTLGQTGFFSIEVEGPRTRRQTDIFRCGPPEYAVLDEGTNAILGPRAAWWEQSEPGMLSIAAFRLRGR